MRLPLLHFLAVNIDVFSCRVDLFSAFHRGTMKNISFVTFVFDA